MKGRMSGGTGRSGRQNVTPADRSRQTATDWRPVTFGSIARRVLAFPFILLIKFYQLCISPLKPPTCRFTPTCSQYALEAFRKYGESQAHPALPSLGRQRLRPRAVAHIPAPTSNRIAVPAPQSLERGRCRPDADCERGRLVPSFRLTSRSTASGDSHQGQSESSVSYAEPGSQESSFRTAMNAL